MDVCINERYFLCREPGSGIGRIIAMNDHLVGPYIQRLPADHLQTKKRQRVFAAFLGLQAGGGNRACCISKIPRFGKVADSFGNHLNARVLQQIQ